MTNSTRSLDYGDRGQVLVVQDGEALASTAANLVKASIGRQSSRGGRALVALSGGSTPKRMGQLFADTPLRDTVDWSSVEMFWGDERWVPLSSPESNAGEAKRGFLDQVAIPKEQVHPFETENLTPEESASAMEETIKRVGKSDVPRFDLVLLGMGDDGHTASLFPGTEAIHERNRLVVSHFVPKLDSTRLTFSPVLINTAKRVAFLVGGAGKAEMLHLVLDGPVDVSVFPSQVVRPIGGNLTWIVDEAAAAQLDRNPSNG
jgi:6-phosphogluconolactonase